MSPCYVQQSGFIRWSFRGYVLPFERDCSRNKLRIASPPAFFRVIKQDSTFAVNGSQLTRRNEPIASNCFYHSWRISVSHGPRKWKRDRRSIPSREEETAGYFIHSRARVSVWYCNFSRGKIFSWSAKSDPRNRTYNASNFFQFARLSCLKSRPRNEPRVSTSILSERERERERESERTVGIHFEQKSFTAIPRLRTT